MKKPRLSHQLKETLITQMIVLGPFMGPKIHYVLLLGFNNYFNQTIVLNI